MSFKQTFITLVLIILVWNIGFFWYKLHHAYPLHEHEFQITPTTTNIPTFIDTVVLDNKMPKFYWKIYLRLFKYDTRLKSGSYTITSPTLSRTEIIQKLVQGPVPKESQELTFIEGWDNDDYITYLKDKGVRIDDVLKNSTVQDYRARYSFLQDAPSNASLQGYLFPDTYGVFLSATEEDVLLKLLNQFDRTLTDQMRIDIKESGRSIYDIVTLASILEREVRQPDTKKMVAGIFYNRLEIGMPLQSDATVNYITNAGRPSPLFSDLEVESPYNTYKYKGLPPGPIANPGLDSLMAAIYPTETSYMYFLTTDEGDIHYARTFNEHVRNKNKYLK